MADEVREWREAVERVCALAGTVDPARMAQRVPACPGWTGRDLLAHMVGLGADVLAGDEPDDHNDAWTQAQVDDRSDRTVADLLHEWRSFADELADAMTEHGTRPLSDVIIHEQDLRGLLGEPGGASSVGFAVVRERLAGRFARHVESAGHGSLALVGEQWTWLSPGLTSASDADVELAASDFDLARAIMSRRSARQLRSWTTRGDVDPLLRCFEVLGDLPVEDLDDGRS
ncbi:maleylpyruvate isomerase N-terminal domain-containing protein [Nocardioides acrostichi]|uniref:Maleylpyruvate isomerase N-terminal domain-containing protein n=1 Tax=Nocardioides acrostichi TaxID=2784339 RepID=A0A930Y8S9_9ACTN|nr:maleylpyruvate isomerase N-terminal domain-containing protein [Nocardioides acrostichi]MBF4163432.1 maleylpyruvate isomerase N-terminal domain-containing protein [Nocardioides acrostichi]